MRIAITGAHGVGKSTLVEDFTAARPGYLAVPEPYWLLAEEGESLLDGASVADLERQLERSCALIAESAAESTASPDVVFDRCPLDFLAYLVVVAADEGFDWVPHPRLLPRVERALASLDLVAFVPLAEPDEIAAAIERPRLRRRVDARLRGILHDDDLGLLEDGPPILEVSGPRSARVATLLAALAA